jgi:hypothetical protein
MLAANDEAVVRKMADELQSDSVAGKEEAEADSTRAEI